MPLPPRKVLLAVHHTDDPKSSPPIILATQMALKGGWVMGPKFPATHAFPIILERSEVGETRDWRLDGQPGGAQRTAWRIEPKMAPTVAWEFPNLSNAAQERGAKRAEALVGTPYDWLEIERQAVAASLQMAANFGPFQKMVRKAASMVGMSDPLKKAAICTRCTELVARDMDLDLRDEIPDLLPERLAQLFRTWELLPVTHRFFSRRMVTFLSSTGETMAVGQTRISVALP